MPPKGWRKNAEGKFPPNPKDLDVVSIDEILFPKSTISKLAKNITTSDNNDSNLIVSKESLVALQRSATVFVSHLMFHARQVAKDADRKNVSAQDILQGLERADLSGFIPEVKQKLASYEANVEVKRKHKADQKAEAASDDHATKKLKDNEKNLVVPIEVDNSGDDTDDEAKDDEDKDDIEDAKDGDDMDLDNTEEETNDTPAPNPIALLGQEEEELEGDREDTVEKVDESSDGED